MNAMSSLLLALQQADSFFPGGAVAWSWGLETLLADGYLGNGEVVAPRRRQRTVRLNR
ncbi:urease accessory protein UreF, partial [Pseudomonas amygdali pv. mori str. 301020]